MPSDSNTTLTDVLAHQRERQTARMRIHDPEPAIEQIRRMQEFLLERGLFREFQDWCERDA
jgi:hypothetical protein